MKKITPAIALLLLIISTSCSTESSEEDKSDQSPISGNLVQKEYASDNYNLEYCYNNSQLLSQITDVFLEEEIHDIILFKYGSKNNVTATGVDSQNSSFRSTTTYQYDNQNRIISSESTSNMNNSDRTWEYTYDGNLVKIIETYRGYDYITNIELNARGLVARMSQGEGYSSFNYDTNGNIKKIQTYDEAGDLKFTYEYSYDNKSNPFFGQLKSLYIPNFVDIMEDLSYGESLIFPYQGYLFPFLKNNLTMIEVTTPQGRAWRNYSYTYSKDGYPLEVFDGPTVDSEFLFEMVYK